LFAIIGDVLLSSVEEVFIEVVSVESEVVPVCFSDEARSRGSIRNM
jgi:hypothetical protein